jgi:hypothetical protein
VIGRLLGCGCMTALALALGLASAWWAVAGSDAAPIRNGAWSYNPLVGSAAADLYTRAKVVTAAPLALNQSEAVYFIATTDDRGDALRSGRRYRLEGAGLDARWWSITAYDMDGFLIANPAHRFSFNSENIARESEGRFAIHLARDPQPGNWLPTGNAGSFFLALRLYNPSPAPRARLATVALPRITPEPAAR